MFKLNEHLERLCASAKYLGIRIPMPRPALRARLIKALEASGLREAIVRVALIPRSSLFAPKKSLGMFEPTGNSKHAASMFMPSAQEASVAGRLASPCIVVRPVQPPARKLYQQGIRLAIVPTRKFPVSQIDPQAKFSSRLGSVLATIEAQLRHADEAIFMDAMGVVTESTASNLCMIKDGVLMAPPCWLGLLTGITWRVVVELAEQLKISVRQASLTRHDLYNADEAFLSSTTKEILPVTLVDGRRIGTGNPGPYTKRLHRAFRQLVRRELRTA